ncbi:MAG: coenzyme-B sulfoethylthiotransferase subunit alpha [Candidatus Helarchaeota archaeon]
MSNRDRRAKESEYTYELGKLVQKFLPTEKERLIYKTMQKTFGLHPMSNVDPLMYKRGGFHQKRRKEEFFEWGRKIARERGIPSYNRAVGIPLGQRALEPYIISGTDVIVDYDDLHHVNNAAMQQMLDDIKRTVIINLDTTHRVLQVRAGKEITPETINLYLETVQHTIAGGAVAQEHMAEIHPGLTADAYCKIITGNDEIVDMIDRRFVINIDKVGFHPSRAAILKRDIGDTIYMVVRAPTISVRMGDGGVTYRWAAMQSSMAFISAYRLTGESIISDIAYAAKSAQVIQIGERTWYSRARSQNEPGGIPYGYFADIQQCDNMLPAEPYFKIIGEDLEEGRRYMRNVAKAGTILALMTELIWYGFYMSGGLGFSTGVAAGAYCGNVVEDLLDNFSEIQHVSISRVKTVPPRWTRIKFITDMMIQAAMETYEKYPSLMEYHWGGAHRISLVGSLAGSAAAMLTGSPMIGQMSMNYAIGMLMKEGWVRTGWAGQEVQDHLGLAYSCAFRMEEGGLIEFRGPNTPYASYTAGHSSGAIGACLAAQLGRGRAYVCNPVIKVAFADPDLKFDFREPRLAIAKAALRQFMPAGERDLIIPSH